MRIIFYMIAALMAYDSPVIGAATSASYDYAAFSALPIQDEGRVKPLDTFARVYLLSLSGKSAMPPQPAIAFLAEVLFSPAKAYTRNVFNIPNPEVLQAIGVLPRDVHYYSYLELSSALRAHAGMIKALYEKDQSALSLAQQQLVDATMKVLHYYQLSQTFVAVASQPLVGTFPMMPPALAGDTELWTSPSDSLSAPQRVRYLKNWKQMAQAYRDHRPELWRYYTEKAAHRVSPMIKGFSSSTLLKLEVLYNKADLFTKALACYIAALIALGVSLWRAGPLMRRVSLGALVLGLGLHGGGIILRMIIMHRPPVSTLYESLVFVSFVAPLLAVLLERRRQDGIDLAIGASLGAILLFISRKYALEGDTMGMLAAVLDTNFWLATHVVTISIGYGCCFVVGMLGHVYLIKGVYAPSDLKTRQALLDQMVGVGLIALFFAMFGTLLGGIWADQSWGRFWGWDPKENGAMLLVLWLLLGLHGKIAKTLSPLTFAAGMALTNIMVALAWFGVNLLNVGLHSYGFTDHIALNLGIFCGLEGLCIGGLYVMNRKHQQV